MPFKIYFNYNPLLFFCHSLLQSVVSFLFDCVNRDRERGYALITLGLMTYSIGDEFEKRGYLAQLISALLNLLNSTKETLSSRHVFLFINEI